MLLVAIALLLPAANAAEGALAVDLLHEAVAMPGLGGLEILKGPLHPGLQVEGGLRYLGGEQVALGQGLRLIGWAHEGVGDALFLSTHFRVELGLPAELRLLVDPVELGLGLAFLPGERWTVGESGLEQSRDPADLRLLFASGLGLARRLGDSPWSLRLGYRAGLELAPPAVFELPFLPRSTLALGASYALGAGP